MWVLSVRTVFHNMPVSSRLVTWWTK
jgi:hypothetical protein